MADSDSHQPPASATPSVARVATKKAWLAWLGFNAQSLYFSAFLLLIVFLCALMFGLAPPLPPRQGSARTLGVVQPALLSLLVVGIVMPFLLRLRQRAHYAEKAIDSTNDGYWVLDGGGRFVDVNEAYCRMVGYSRAEIMRMSIADFEAVASAAQIKAQIHRILQKGHERFETRHRHQNGQWVDLEITVTRVDDHHVVAFLRDVSERKAAEAKIHQLAFFDPLTGLPNRRLMQDRIEQALVNSARSQCHGALLFLDLDNFKLINDNWGHATGDELLVCAAERLRGCVRVGDTVSRQGGDEFVVILERLSDQADRAALQVEFIAEKCRAAIGEVFLLGKGEFHVSASIGLTLFCGIEVPHGLLLQRADTAMYQAKAGGRDQVVFFEPEMQESLARRTQLESDLRHALSEGQLLLHFQPQWGVGQRLLGAEALLRWQHPQKGLIAPLEFIPLAEESRLILPIGAWVLESACRHLASWSAIPALSGLQLAVNVSALQFDQADFVAQIAGLLAEGRFMPNLLKLELTESLVMDDAGDAIRKMKAIQALGVRMSMDDFGTGQSSLANLRRLPLQELKIDQSFVADLTDESGDMAIVRTVIALGQALGLEVMAEGVETDAQRRILELSGCASYQGFLFGHPVPLHEFESASVSAHAAALLAS